MNQEKSMFRWFVLVAVLLMAGCGFQLRGAANLPIEMNMTHVSGISEYNEFGREIRRALRGNGVSVVKTMEGSTAELRIIENLTDRRVLSVQASGVSSGKVEEYELFHRLRFKVIAQDGRTLLDTQSLEVTRDYLFDRNDPLGKSGEEEAIRVEMRRDLVQLMMMRLQAISTP